MKKYNIIYADPPWDVKRGPDWNSNGPGTATGQGAGVKASKKQSKPQARGRSLHPVVGSPNSDTPRVTNVLADMVEPLAKANSSEEFTAALKDALQRLIAEAKKLERENIRQDKMLENALVLACERSRRGWIDRELYAVLGISMEGPDRTSNSVIKPTSEKA